ncbi:universal stress protein [Streptomyces piniterrae]|uniref:Universal stress protein n=1 Tax=Streptomyces piniterrae TaxID=2571125 RepID=A0A4U0NW88_9ACTN|nr:universal stress protein [Streptomyces piniterrae]TJZ58973.1 universal stress protein [Streptomyces piniterrae]
MELPLVVGVDGSDSAYRALAWALDEAALHGLPLRLVYASRWERYEGMVPAQSMTRPTEQLLADNIVGSAAEYVHQRNPDVHVSVQVLAEDTVTALLREGRYASALILGSKGRGEFADLLLGSVSLSVAARAECPVAVVRGDKAALSGSHDRVLLGVGDPEKGTQPVQYALREAEARGCALDAVRAWRCPAHETTDHPLLAGAPELYHEERASALLDKALGAVAGDHPMVHIRRATVEGPPHKVLVRRSAAADLLVVGAQRRHGHFGLQLGRVGHVALHHAECPVVVVPQPG